jgi:UPF0755 protein
MDDETLDPASAPDAPAPHQRPPRATQAGRRARSPRDARPRGASPRGSRPAPKTPRAKRRRAGCLAALLLILVVFGGGAAYGWWMLYKPATTVTPGQPVQLEVIRGSSTAEIGELLAASGVVDNALMFRLQARSSTDQRPLKAGIYDLTTGMGYEPAMNVLRVGPPVIEYFSITIPEGWTLEQIAKRVEEKANIPAAEFLTLASTGASQFTYPFLADNRTGSLQGYLFPKTYRLEAGTTAKGMIDAMLTQFGKETAGLDLAYARSHGVDMHGLVTIASIIEREARVAKDRPVISSVIYNRLAKNMKLEICATVQFIVGNKPRLLYSDLKVESPYNTYLHQGLPPGPIASPGLASLQAAAAPAETSYLFYVLTHKDGSHSFSKTTAEHNRYKAQAAKGLK